MVRKARPKMLLMVPSGSGIYHGPQANLEDPGWMSACSEWLRMPPVMRRHSRSALPMK